MKKYLKIAIVLSIIFSFAIIPSYAFSDVNEGDWFYEYADYVVSEGLFNGVSETEFAPHNTMTRGMFITVLGRMADVSTNYVANGMIIKDAVNLRSEPNTTSNVVDVLENGDTFDVIGVSDDWYKIHSNGKVAYVRGDLATVVVAGFSDVKYSAYYAPYISWACGSGIASGTGESKFSPDTAITREEICVYLANYALYSNITLPNNVAKTAFTDETEIANPEAVYLLQQSGVINGRDDGSFDPTASASRCEVAALFQRFCELDSVEEYVPEEDPFTDYDIFATIPPETAPADDSYFDDACFIGHSLVVGMKNYFGLPNADFYAVSGISAKTMLDYNRFKLEATETDENGEVKNKTGTIADVLQEKSYGKIYIMLGINEMGPETYHADTYYNSMSSLVDIVRSANPNATIYLISITPVTQKLSDESANFNRENILIFSDKLQQVAIEKDVFYLDAFNIYANEHGYMPDNYTATDGLHIVASMYSVLKNLIQTHAV